MFLPSAFSPEEFGTHELLQEQALCVPCTHWFVSQHVHGDRDWDVQLFPWLSCSSWCISGGSNWTPICVKLHKSPWNKPLALEALIVPKHKLNGILLKFTLIQRPTASRQAGWSWLCKQRRVRKNKSKIFLRVQRSAKPSCEMAFN